MPGYLRLNLFLFSLILVAISGFSYTWSFVLLMHDFSLLTSSVIGVATFFGLLIPALMHFRANAILHKLATVDSLTGLLNRDAFTNKLHQFIQSEKKFHLLMIDLNKFKSINDSLGHNIGDMVLQDVAVKLTESVRECDVLARLGGDEFAILVCDETHSDTYQLVINRIVKNVNAPTKIDGHHLYITTSIGVASYPETHKNSVELLRCADVAMYSAKRTQKDFCLFRHEDDTANTTDLLLMGELRSAIDDGDCEIWFQPKKNLHTGIIDAAECLMRWRHPIRGLINPGSFIPVAEASGLIKLITQFVIKEATDGYKTLQAAGHELTLSINVSPVDIIDPAIMTSIIKSIVKADMPPERLVLEVTETAIMADPSAVFKVLIALESLGINLSIDDFGTGHSSLLYLKNFPIHEVKLDRSFIIDIISNIESRTIVESTIDLSHTLKAITVAEGVESSEIEEVLRELNCDYVQGYYVAKAMPLTEFIEWLSINKGKR